MEISQSEIITVTGKRGETLQISSRKRTVITFKLYYVTQELPDFLDLQMPTNLQSKYRYLQSELQLTAAKLAFLSYLLRKLQKPLQGLAVQKLKTAETVTF